MDVCLDKHDCEVSVPAVHASPNVGHISKRDEINQVRRRLYFDPYCLGDK